MWPRFLCRNRARDQLAGNKVVPRLRELRHKIELVFVCVCVCYFRPFLTQLHRTPVSEWKVVRRLTLSECETSVSCPRFISQVGQGLSPGDTVQ